MARQSRDKIFELVELKQPPKSSVVAESKDRKSDDATKLQDFKSETDNNGDVAGKDSTKPFTDDYHLYQGLVKHTLSKQENYTPVHKPKSEQDLVCTDTLTSKSPRVFTWNTWLMIGLIVVAAVVAAVILTVIILAVVYRMTVSAQGTNTDQQFSEVMRELAKVSEAVMQINGTLSNTNADVDLLKNDTLNLYQMHDLLSLQAVANFNNLSQSIDYAHSNIQNLSDVTTQAQINITRNALDIDSNQTRLTQVNSSLTEKIAQAHSDIMNNTDAIKVSQTELKTLNSSMTIEVARVNGQFNSIGSNLQAIEMSLNSTVRRVSRFSQFNLLANCTSSVNSTTRRLFSANSEIEFSVSAQIDGATFLPKCYMTSSSQDVSYLGTTLTISGSNGTCNCRAMTSSFTTSIDCYIHHEVCTMVTL